MNQDQMIDYAISIQAISDNEAHQEIIRNLVSYNSIQAGGEPAIPILVTLHDPQGSLCGGVRGHTQWGWLYISTMWLHESIRGKGWGRKLIQATEAEAVRRGCQACHLDTYSFQALGFYEKLGYKQFGVLENYPIGSNHKRYYLVKQHL